MLSSSVCLIQDNHQLSKLSPQASQALEILHKFKKEQLKYINNNQKESNKNYDTNIQNDNTQFELKQQKDTIECSNNCNYSFAECINNIQYSGKVDKPTPDFKEKKEEKMQEFYEATLSHYLTKFQLQQQQKEKNLEFKKNETENDLKNIMKQYNNSKILKQENKENQIKLSLFQNKLNCSKLNNLDKNIFTQDTNQIQRRNSNSNNFNPKYEFSQRSTSSKNGEQLYKKGMYQKERLKNFIQQGINKKVQLEMKECTFIPKINNSIQNSQSSFFGRLETWIQKKEDKLSQQQELKKIEQTKECTFSPNPKETIHLINYCDIYYRNQKWANQLNQKKQKLKMRNSMIELNTPQQVNNQKKSLKRSASSLSQNENEKFITTNELKIQSNIKSCKSTRHSQTETTCSPNSLQKRKSSIEEINEKYQVLCQLVNKIQTKKNK